MENYLLISDAAKEVKVESHVLRYWEEELHLPIKRNELGHRYYTREDVERFKQIKSMKERGLQLKAIKMILKDGKIDVMMPEEEKEAIRKEEDREEADRKEADRKESRRKETSKKEYAGREPDKRARDSDGEAVNDAGYGEESEKEYGAPNRLSASSGLAIDIVETRDAALVQESREEKARRLQWLLQQLIRETLQENNKELCRDIRDSVMKELDYQFRSQEERQEQRDRLQYQRSEEYYQRMDELLRSKSRLRKLSREKKKREKGRKEENDAPYSAVEWESISRRGASREREGRGNTVGRREEREDTGSDHEGRPFSEEGAVLRGAPVLVNERRAGRDSMYPENASTASQKTADAVYERNISAMQDRQDISEGSADFDRERKQTGTEIKEGSLQNRSDAAAEKKVIAKQTGEDMAPERPGTKPETDRKAVQDKPDTTADTGGNAKRVRTNELSDKNLKELKDASDMSQDRNPGTKRMKLTRSEKKALKKKKIFL